MASPSPPADVGAVTVALALPTSCAVVYRRPASIALPLCDSRRIGLSDRGPRDLHARVSAFVDILRTRGDADVIEAGLKLDTWSVRLLIDPEEERLLSVLVLGEPAPPPQTQ